ncbi:MULTISPECIES: methylated-DNA--[protein]-cysteine S-methyltransferase [Calditerrivibrio]
MECFLICNFFDIVNLKISWSFDGIPESIDFTYDSEFLNGDLPCNIRKMYQILKNYYSFERYDIFDVLGGVEFTSFERKVYKRLLEVPAGEVITYSELANEIGIKGGARAVGNAMRRNRFPILIPCHRVVGKKDLGGFTPGLELKKKLLDYEKQWKSASGGT